jgi:transposase
MTDPQNSQIIIGVDTHKLTHVAVAIDSHGKRLSEKHVSANTQGYIELEEWSRSFGTVKLLALKVRGPMELGSAVI